MRKLFLLLILLSFYSHAQNIAVMRGDSVIITVKAQGNYLDDPMSFVVKAGKNFSDNRLIMKTTDDDVSTEYGNLFTYVSVIIRPIDTEDLEAKTYYYDVYDSVYKKTIVNGNFTILSDVQTPFDGTDLPENATRITTVSLANGSLQNEYAKWDTTLKAWVPSGVVPGSGSVGNADSLGGKPASEYLVKNDSTAQRTFSDLKYATKAQLSALQGEVDSTESLLNNKASIVLDNLGTTSINADLIPDSDNLRYLGSATKAWTLGYINSLIFTRNGYGVTVGLTGVLTQQSNLYFPRNVNGTMALGTGTANQLAYWVGTNTLGSLTTSTYPTLTELAYIKGVTSNIQTQLDSKLAYTDTSVVNDLIQEWSDTASVTSNYSLGHIDTTVAKVDSITISIATFNSLIATLQTLVTQLSGGTTGQALVKASDNDYDFVWATIGTPDLSDNTPPLAPTSYVAIGGTSQTQYVTTWTDPVASDLLKIYWYEGSANDTTTLTLVDSINAGVQTYTRTGRTANTTYWSAIKAVDDSGNVSYFSNVDSATTLNTSGATPVVVLDFEENNLSEWSSTSGANLSASNTVAHTGTYSMRVGTNSYGIYNFTADTEVWLTFWIYLPSTSSQSASYNYISMFDNGIADRTCFGTNNSTWSEWIVGVNSGNMTDNDYTTNFSQDTWHKVKIYYQTNGTTTSNHQVWVDDTSIWSTTAAYVNSVSNFTVGSEAATITNYFYIDDIKLYTSDPGTQD